MNGLQWWSWCPILRGKPGWRQCFVLDCSELQCVASVWLSAMRYSLEQIYFLKSHFDCVDRLQYISELRQYRSWRQASSMVLSHAISGLFCTVLSYKCLYFNFCVQNISDIQSVPLDTEIGISLIILTPMKILQRNLTRSTFVVWEMKKNVSVLCVIFLTKWGKSASKYLAVSSLEVELLKKCQVRQRMGHTAHTLITTVTT